MRLISLVMMGLLSTSALANDFTCVANHGYVPLGGTLEGVDFKDVGDNQYELTHSTWLRRDNPVVTKSLGTFSCQFDDSGKWLFRCTLAAAATPPSDWTLVQSRVEQVTVLAPNGEVSSRSLLNVVAVKKDIDPVTREPQAVSLQTAADSLGFGEVRCVKDQTFAEIMKIELSLR